jgi:hypothetical protein
MSGLFTGNIAVVPKPTVSGLFSKAGRDKPLQKLLDESLKLLAPQKKQCRHNNKHL